MPSSVPHSTPVPASADIHIMPDNLCKSLFSLFCVFIMSMLMGSAEAGRNEAFKNYKRLFLTCIAKKLCSENLFSSSILHLKRCRRHDFRPTRHLARTYFGEGSKMVRFFLKFRQNQLTDRNGRPLYGFVRPNQE